MRTLIFLLLFFSRIASGDSISADVDNFVDFEISSFESGIAARCEVKLESIPDNFKYYPSFQLILRNNDNSNNAVLSMHTEDERTLFFSVFQRGIPESASTLEIITSETIGNAPWLAVPFILELGIQDQTLIYSISPKGVDEKHTGEFVLKNKLVPSSYLGRVVSATVSVDCGLRNA